MKTLSKDHNHWSTQDEINFLRGLGGWGRPGEHLPGEPKGNTFTDGKISINFDPKRRLILLQHYKEDLIHRKDWGLIIVGEILEYLNGQLKIYGIE